MEAPFEIITIYNYPREHTHSARMLRVWAMQAVAALRESRGRVSRVRIISMTNGLDAELRAQIASTHSSEELEFETNDECGQPPPREQQSAHHTWQLAVYKLYILCSRKTPFVFVDADAIIMAPSKIGEILDASRSQPVVAIDHQQIIGHTAHFLFKFANTGVLAVSDPSVLVYEQISTTPIKRWCPGGDDDQARLNNHFWNSEYVYTSTQLEGAGWNACGAFRQSRAAGAKVSRRSDGVGFEVTSVTEGLIVPSENNVPVRVLHYWFRYKPWLTPCDIYTELETGLVASNNDETNLLICVPNDIIINASVVDGSDAFDAEIPIGVGWKFATLSESEQAVALSVPRTPIQVRNTLLHVGFDVTTDAKRRGGHRAKIAGTLAARGFPNAGARLPYREFLASLRDAAFVASPEGNGIDCHRHYEAWVSGAVPVIEFNSLSVKKFEGMPVVWTFDGYADITRERLLSEMENIRAGWKAGAYSDRVAKILRPSSYNLEHQKTILTRSNFWVARLSGAPLGITNSLAFARSPISAAAGAAASLLNGRKNHTPDERNRISQVASACKDLSERFKHDSSLNEFNRAAREHASLPTVTHDGSCNEVLRARLLLDDSKTTWRETYGRVGEVVLRHFASSPQPLRIAEVGVARGGHVEHMVGQLGAKLECLIGVDPYAAAYDPKDGFCIQYGEQATLDGMHSWVRERMRPHSDKFALVRMRSTEFASLVDDCYFDAVYIGGSHLYEDVRADIAAWRRKVRPGGLLLFDDYAGTFFPGVKAAVRELVTVLGVPMPPDCNPAVVAIPNNLDDENRW